LFVLRRHSERSEESLYLHLSLLLLSHLNNHPGFPQYKHYFQKKTAVPTDAFPPNREYLSTQRKRNLPVGESRQGPSGEPATGLTEQSGNWLLTDGTEKALTANVMTESMASAGSARKSHAFRGSNQL
jgi:hypothetical protein